MVNYGCRSTKKVQREYFISQAHFWSVPMRLRYGELISGTTNGTNPAPTNPTPTNPAPTNHAPTNPTPTNHY